MRLKEAESVTRISTCSRNRLLPLLASTLLVRSLLLSATPAHATPYPTNNWVAGHTGPVLKNLKIYNYYMSNYQLGGSWDDFNPTEISKAKIDQATRDLVSSNYFDRLQQYGVQSATFLGSQEVSWDTICPVPQVVPAYVPSSGV